MTRFGIEVEKTFGFEIYNLIDYKASVNAKIIPDLGTNLVSLKIENNNEDLELIYIPMEIKNLRGEVNPFYGNPILFPFPGRIPEGYFTFKKQEFHLPINFRDGTAIHGFVYNKKWEVTEFARESEKAVFIKAIYQSDSSIDEFFPFPFRLEMLYILRESELEMVFKAENTGSSPFPFGYGLHPYFLLGGERKNWVLDFSAATMYELVNLLPTGKRQPVPADLDFRKEKPLEGIFMDNLFGNLKRDREGKISVALKNRRTNFKLSVISDQNFDYYVLYAPKEHNFICIEPYTCIPNAYNLDHAGITTGLRTLAPKEIFEGRILFKWEI
ncbi:MAG TPA: aldose 1-epimerase [Candidatus Deferrimicrobium sp.]|nr:aldose 1-epimerase [Candidatus Deferrimicrobium sp.]